jgi:E3 ubiquitin-protein ligase makorin
MDPVDTHPACIVCFEEEPSQYGLLVGCDHAVCLNCIRKWRSTDKSELSLTQTMAKTCPACRTHSDYVVPSFNFYPRGDLRDGVISGYKEKLQTIDCKYGQCCRFRDKCFYRHLEPFETDIYPRMLDAALLQYAQSILLSYS